MLLPPRYDPHFAESVFLGGTLMEVQAKDLRSGEDVVFLVPPEDEISPIEGTVQDYLLSERKLILRVYVRGDRISRQEILTATPTELFTVARINAQG